MDCVDVQLIRSYIGAANFCENTVIVILWNELCSLPASQLSNFIYIFKVTQLQMVEFIHETLKELFCATRSFCKSGIHQNKNIG